MLNQTVTREATAVCKGMEMTHGNSFHYLTFELDSGERVYFQVSIKCYMMIVEGDRCLITYRDSRSSSKKKLKSFEIIAKTIPASTQTRRAEPILASAQTQVQMTEPDLASIPIQEIETVFESEEVQVFEQEAEPMFEPEILPMQKHSNQRNQNRAKSNQRQRIQKQGGAKGG